MGAILLAAASLASAAGQWSSPEMVRPNDGYDSIFPNVEVSPEGVVWVVWSGEDPVEHDSETYYVTIQDFVPSERRKIHADNSIMDCCPIMTMGSDGVPWVVWERYSSASGYLQVVTHWTGTAWSPAELVFSLGAAWDEYTIHASSSSDVWVAKSSRAARTDRDIYLRHWDGSAWGGIDTVGFSGHNDISPAMTTDGLGRTWLAWLRRNDVSGRDYVCAAWRGDSGWSEPAVVDSGPGDIRVNDMAVCPDGRPIITWVGDGNTTAGNVKFATLSAGAWVYGGLVNAPDDPWSDIDGASRLSRGPDGEMWAVWGTSTLGTTSRAVMASQWQGSCWGEEELVSAPDTASLQADGMPDVAVAPDGRVWAVWERQADEYPYDTDIYRSYRDIMTAVDVWGLCAEPQGSSVTISWHASPYVAQMGLHVWRSEGKTCGGQGTGIPSGAVCLTDVAIRNCMSCSFIDSTAAVPGTYCYWLAHPSGETYGPVTASVVDAPLPAAQLTVSPNPTRNGVVFSAAGYNGPATIRICTAGGRVVRTLALMAEAGGHRESETVTVSWDGTDDAGSEVPCGVYFAEFRRKGARTPGGSVRVVILR